MENREKWKCWQNWVCWQQPSKMNKPPEATVGEKCLDFFSSLGCKPWQPWPKLDHTSDSQMMLIILGVSTSLRVTWRHLIWLASFGHHSQTIWVGPKLSTHQQTTLCEELLLPQHPTLHVRVTAPTFLTTLLLHYCHHPDGFYFFWNNQICLTFAAATLTSWQPLPHLPPTAATPQAQWPYTLALQIHRSASIACVVKEELAKTPYMWRNDTLLKGTLSGPHPRLRPLDWMLPYQWLLSPVHYAIMFLCVSAWPAQEASH